MHGLTVALGVWAVIAPLVGILLGHYLTRSWQREHWLRDCRKEEFRELLTTLTRSYAVLIPLGMPQVVLDAAARRTLGEASASALTVLRDRIFVAEDIKRDQIFDLWSSAVKTFESDHNAMKFAQAYAVINSLIVSAAKADGRSPNVVRRLLRRFHSQQRTFY